MSEKPYKALGIDLLASALHDREQAIDTFVAGCQRIESAQLADIQAGPKAFQRLRAAAVNERLHGHIQRLDHALAENQALLQDTIRAREAAEHLRALRADAARAARQLEATAEPNLGRPSPGPSP